MEVFLLVAIIVGLLVYGYFEGKPSEIGKWVFVCAFLAVCLHGAVPHLRSLL